MKTIRKGSTGDAVLTWQGILGIGESGDFDQITEDWTKAWQRQRGIEPDGVVGPKTWAVAGFVERVTTDIDDDFFPKLRLVAMALGARATDMLRVMYSESACRATAWNDNPKSLPPEKRWNASGLIQFMPPTLVGLGWTAGHAAFRETQNATAQLSWVHRYYMPYRGHLGTVGGLYVATFLPALIKHAGDRDFVLTAKAGVLPWAYGPNAAFDADKDLRITVGELEDAVARNCHGTRWDELLARLTAGDAVPTLPALDNPASSPSMVVQPIVHVDPTMYRLEKDPDGEG
jgi:hypothetical protein